MTASAPKLFISYRREETAGHAGRLYDAMAERFGESNVLMDIGLTPGIDFAKRIEEAVGECRVVVAVIGPRWASVPDEQGRSRLADPEDFVRLEVGTALHRSGITVIPALVAEARMPDPDDLPEDLRALAHRDAVELSDQRWRYDVGRLMSALERLVSFAAPQQAPAASTSALPRRAVFAGYRVEEVAGRGGMGVVYRATQLALDRTVALKLIVPELAENADFRERFKRESHLAASIEHPHVIPVYEAGESGEHLFISMRYIDGSDLRKLIGTGSLTPDRAVAIVNQIAAALDAAHRRGLVHRDVKPANILIANDGGEHAYLTDFGLTKRTTSAGGLTATGQFVGTADYTAPEQIMGEPTDARTDVYALGCVLYHALTGQTVYQRETEVAVMYAQLHEPPPRVTATDPGLPRALDEVIERAMAKDPDRRYPSAGDLGRAAAAATAGSRPGEPERSVATGAASTRVLDTPPQTRSLGDRDRGAGHVTASQQTLPAGDAKTSVPPEEGRRHGREAHPGPPPRRAMRALAAVAGVGFIVVLALIATGALRDEGGDASSKRPLSQQGPRTFAARSSVHDVTARGDLVVWERKVAGGLRLSERRGGRIRDLPPAPAYNYAGMELGTDSAGRQVLIYSRCTAPRYACQLYVYRFDTERAELVSDVSKARCDEYGASISAGTISFSRGWRTATCQGGVFLKPPGRAPLRLAGRPGTTDVSEALVAWDVSVEPYDLRLARVERPSARRTIAPTRKGARLGRPVFLNPVLNGRFLYFVEGVADDRYLIARTDALKRRGIRRYGVSFTDVPAFTVEGGDLLYSGNTRSRRPDGRDVIARDDDPTFK